MAACTTFDITFTGRGAHGALPHQSNDPVMIAVTAAQALQTIVSRNVKASQAAILSITQIHAGTAYNVIPNSAALHGPRMPGVGRSIMCASAACRSEVEAEIDPVWWSPPHFRRRLLTRPKPARLTPLNSAARLSIWSASAAIPMTSPESSSRPRGQSVTGSPSLTGETAVGRKRTNLSRPMNATN